MKFSITFKTPDAVDDALKEHFEVDAYDESPKAMELLGHRENAEMLMSQFVQHGEYVTIEFDTDAKTATVQKKGK